MDRPERSGIVVLIVGFTALALVLGWQIRAITGSPYPRLRASETLTIGIPLLLIVLRVGVLPDPERGCGQLHPVTEQNGFAVLHHHRFRHRRVRRHHGQDRGGSDSGQHPDAVRPGGLRTGGEIDLRCCRGGAQEEGAGRNTGAPNRVGQNRLSTDWLLPEPSSSRPGHVISDQQQNGPSVSIRPKQKPTQWRTGARPSAAEPAPEEVGPLRRRHDVVDGAPVRVPSPAVLRGPWDLRWDRPWLHLVRSRDPGDRIAEPLGNPDRPLLCRAGQRASDVRGPATTANCWPPAPSRRWNCNSSPR